MSLINDIPPSDELLLYTALTGRGSKPVLKLSSSTSPSRGGGGGGGGGAATSLGPIRPILIFSDPSITEAVRGPDPVEVERLLCDDPSLALTVSGPSGAPLPWLLLDTVDGPRLPLTTVDGPLPAPLRVLFPRE